MKLPLLLSLTLAACLAAPTVAHADGDQQQAEQRLQKEKQLLQELSSEPDQTGGPSASGQRTSSSAPYTTPSQRRSMDQRTRAAFQYYKRAGYRRINELLRDPETAEVADDGNLKVGGMFTDHSLDEFQEMIRAMGDYMFGAKKYQGATVYRGVTLKQGDIDILKELGAKHGVWRDGGFFSTAAAVSLQDWVKKSDFSKREIVMVVDLSKAKAKDEHGGVDIDSDPEIKGNVGGYHEAEVLFPPTQRFKVVKIVDDPKEVKKELGLGNDAKAPKMLVRLEAEPYTKEDAELLDTKVNDLAQRISKQESGRARGKEPTLGRKADMRNPKGDSLPVDVAPLDGREEAPLDERKVDPLDGRNDSVNPLDGREVAPLAGTAPGRRPGSAHEGDVYKRPPPKPDHMMHGE